MAKVLLPPLDGWGASPLRVTPQHFFKVSLLVHWYPFTPLRGKRKCRAKFLVKGDKTTLRAG